MLKQRTVYFREEDIELWEAVQNKAEFLHNALHFGTRRKYDDVATLDFSKDKPTTAQDRSFTKKPIEVVRDLFPQAKELCKIHGTPMTTQGKCLQKGCKYA